MRYLHSAHTNAMLFFPATEPITKQKKQCCVLTLLPYAFFFRACFFRIAFSRVRLGVGSLVQPPLSFLFLLFLA